MSHCRAQAFSFWGRFEHRLLGLLIAGKRLQFTILGIQAFPRCFSLPFICDIFNDMDFLYNFVVTK